MSLSGAVEGNASQLQNIAANDVLPLEGSIVGSSLPAFQSYAQYLNQITSTDPALRTKAAAPAIAQDTAQTKQALNQIAAGPRGGEQNFLRANAVQNQATNTGNVLNELFSQGEASKGELGAKGIAESLSAIRDIGQLDTAAAQIESGQEEMNAQNWQAIVGALGSIGETAAGAYETSQGGGGG